MCPFKSAFHGTERTIPTFHGVFSPFFGWNLIVISITILSLFTVDYSLPTISCGSLKIQIKSLHIACSSV